MSKKQQQTLVMVAALGAAVYLMTRRGAAAPAGTVDGAAVQPQAPVYTPPQFGVSYQLPDWLTKPWGEFTPPGAVTPSTVGQPYVSQPFGVSFI